MGVPLIATRRRMPPLPNGVLRRARLIDTLEREVPHHKLSLVAAPAGYGKTTLLSQ